MENTKPAKLFRLSYSHEFYVCTCDAENKDDCTCAQVTLVTTHPNPYLVDAELVSWLHTQSEPFSITQAIEALGLTEFYGRSKNTAFAAALGAFKELKKCGCTRLDSGLFTRPSCETLTISAFEGLQAQWRREFESLRFPDAGCAPSSAHAETPAQAGDPAGCLAPPPSALSAQQQSEAPASLTPQLPPAGPLPLESPQQPSAPVDQGLSS